MMNIIGLLSKISNGEEPPKKIRAVGYIFIYTGDKRLQRMYKMENQDNYLFRDFVYTLSSEVEIIEDDNDIEAIEYSVNDCGEISINGFDYDDEQKLQLVEKLNELIVAVNKLKNNSQND